MKFSDLTNKDSSDRLHDNSCACHGSSEDLSDSQKSPNSMSDTEMLTFSHVTVTSKHEHNGSLEHHEASFIKYTNTFMKVHASTCNNVLHFFTSGPPLACSNRFQSMSLD